MWQIPPLVLYIIFFIDFFIAFFFLIAFIKIRPDNKVKKEEDFELTFVIPAFNCEKIIEKTIDSIKKARYNQDKIKIIIVNDSSTDNTLYVMNKIAKKYKGITIFTKKHGGKANSLNFGLKKAGTELVAVLDADTLIKEDLLEKAIPLFSEETMAVTARFKPLNNNKIIERLQDMEYAFAGFSRLIVGNLNSLPVAPAFTIFKRKFFLKYGYFDEGNLTEDLEMGLRIQSANYNVAYVTHSYATTDVPNNLKKLLRQRLRWSYGTLYNYAKYKKLFFNRKYGDLGIFILPISFLSIFLISLVFLFGVYSLFAWIVDYIRMFSVGWMFTLDFDIGKFLIRMTNLQIILFFVTIIIALVMLFLVNYELQEKLKLRYYVLYLTVFLWMLAIFYILSIAYFVIKKKPEW